MRSYLHISAQHVMCSDKLISSLWVMSFNLKPFCDCVLQIKLPANMGL